MVTQADFDKLFTQKSSNLDKCVVMDCPFIPVVIIVKDNKKYGVCRGHWKTLGKSDVQWTQKR